MTAASQVPKSDRDPTGGSAHKAKNFLVGKSTAIAIGVFTIGLGWYLFERQHAELQLTLTADIPILTSTFQLPPELVLTNGSDTISALRALEIRVTNTGNLSLIGGDFEQPLSVTFPAEVSTTPIVTHRQPAALSPTLEVDTPRRRIAIAPLLLNPGDAFSFRVLLQNWADSVVPVTAVARIRGVRDIDVKDMSRPATRRIDRITPGDVLPVAALVGFFFLVIGIAMRVNLAKLPRRVRNAVILAERAEQSDGTVAARARDVLAGLPSGDTEDEARRSDCLFARLALVLRERALHANRPFWQRPKHMGNALPWFRMYGIVTSRTSELVEEYIGLAHQFDDLYGKRAPELYSGLQRIGAIAIAALELEPPPRPLPAPARRHWWRRLMPARRE